MGTQHSEAAAGKGAGLELPARLTERDEAFPIVFADATEVDIAEPETWERTNGAIYEALRFVHPGEVCGQAVVKVHIGEPKCVTRMNPAYAASSVRFLWDAGANGVVAGDTTVAYTGGRGHRQNPPGDASRYLELARRHGWSADGTAGLPFVVLDRPCTAAAGRFEFSEHEKRIEVAGIRRFRDFYLAGGFGAADFMINHAHLTLHGLAGIAGCVKSIAMGCSSLRGKLRMHQALLPHFDPGLCAACGDCVEACPEGALQLADEADCPTVDPELCIGCGECEAVCALTHGAVRLEGERITDWQRGEDSLPRRMADYTMGLMAGRWENTIHVLHMYTITERCDCVDARQTPMLERNLGFLVGKNPFAIDELAGRMLAQALQDEGREADEVLLKSAEAGAAYAAQTYGVLREVPLEELVV